MTALTRILPKSPESANTSQNGPESFGPVRPGRAALWLARAVTPNRWEKDSPAISEGDNNDRPGKPIVTPQAHASAEAHHRSDAENADQIRSTTRP